MNYPEDDYLQLSGLQHFKFCRRQWALIHIENQWAENLRTVEGSLLHTKAHDALQRERRGDTIVTRDLRIFSPSLGVSGACDVVEFQRSDTGISLPGEDGLWRVYPIEYKHGSPRTDTANDLQLCAQAMCLEEMLCCDIPEGALFYGETRHRQKVLFTDTLRQEVLDCLAEMHQYFSRGYTPRVKPTKSCNACSLKEICTPKLLRSKSVQDYIAGRMEDAP